MLPKLVTPEHDQRRVGHRAGQADGEDVLAAQTLTQDEGVLRADGDDQAQAHRHACDRHWDIERHRTIPKVGSCGLRYRAALVI